MLKDFMNKPTNATLSIGEYKVKLINFSIIASKTDATKEYAQCIFMTDNNIKVTRNLFEVELSIFINSAKRALNLAETNTKPIDIINQLINDKMLFSVYIHEVTAKDKKGILKNFINWAYFNKPNTTQADEVTNYVA